MRALIVFSITALVFAASDADARRSRKAPSGPLNTVVVPFEGAKAGGAPIAESIELELELVEYVVVKASKRAKRDLRNGGAKAFKPDRLSKIMRKRGIDVLIRGVRAKGTRGGRDKLHIYAYGVDGKARSHFEVPIPGRKIDATAVNIVKNLTPALRDWRELRPILEPGEKPKRVAAAEPEFDESDLFVDIEGDDPEPEPKPKRKLAEPNVDDILAADDEVEAAPPPRRSSGRRLLGGDDEGPEPADGPDDMEEPDDLEERRARRRRAILGDDEEPKEEKKSRRLADDAPYEPGDLAATSFVTLETAIGGGIWIYDFSGKIADQSFSPGVLRKLGGAAKAQVWFQPFVGAELDVRGLVLSDVSLGDIGISPNVISTTAVNVGLSLKLRYVYEAGPLAIGFGARGGYRFNQGSVEPQLDERNNLLTIIPGWDFHAGSLGGELYLAYRVAERRFELQLHADGLLPRYKESPDNPGADVVATGWDIGLTVRVPIIQPVFVTLTGFTGGIFADFNGSGDRFGLAQNEDGSRSALAGGTVINTTSGGGLGLGVFF